LAQHLVGLTSSTRQYVGNHFGHNGRIPAFTVPINKNFEEARTTNANPYNFYTPYLPPLPPNVDRQLRFTLCIHQHQYPTVKTS
jgi:hypothetical protein